MSNQHTAVKMSSVTLKPFSLLRRNVLLGLFVDHVCMLCEGQEVVNLST